MCVCCRQVSWAHIAPPSVLNCVRRRSTALGTRTNQPNHNKADPSWAICRAQGVCLIHGNCTSNPAHCRAGEGRLQAALRLAGASKQPCDPLADVVWTQPVPTTAARQHITEHTACLQAPCLEASEQPSHTAAGTLATGAQCALQCAPQLLHSIRGAIMHRLPKGSKPNQLSFLATPVLQ